VKAYLDSSALVKLYYPEPESERVERWVHLHNPQLLFTSLHALELRNAMNLKLFRDEISGGQYAAWARRFEQDRSHGVLHSIAPNWSRVFLQAEHIAESASRRSGTRSLDVLHIAAANDSATDVFITNDARQGHAAKQFGLVVIFVTGLD
jgi:predicted nucleic acid-binding protein